MMSRASRRTIKGSFFRRPNKPGGRWWFDGQLPDEQERSSRPCKRPSDKFAATDREVAEGIIWDLWQEALLRVEAGHDQPDRPRTILELVAKYLAHCDQSLRDPATGKHIPSYSQRRCSFEHLKQLYGEKPIESLLPGHLKKVMEAEAAAGRNIQTVNVRRWGVLDMYTWAQSFDWVSVVQVNRLRTECKAWGRNEFKLARPVNVRKPVPESVLQATMPWISRVMRAMINVQLGSLCRPGEVCRIRRRHVHEYPNGVMTVEFEQCENKTGRFGYDRTFYLGPTAQEAIRPFLVDREPDEFVFQARESRYYGHRLNLDKMEYDRKAIYEWLKKHPTVNGKAYWTTGNYGGCITQAIKVANRVITKANKTRKAEGEELLPLIPHWSPHQIRHTGATKALKESGNLILVATLLGHKDLESTQRYAKPDMQQAIHLISKVG